MAANAVIGMGVKATTRGFFLDRTLTQLEITRVDPRSPAAIAGIKVGDDVLSIDGTAVKGASALGMKHRFDEIHAGDRIRLTLERSGRTVHAVIIAGSVNANAPDAKLARLSAARTEPAP